MLVGEDKEDRAVRSGVEIRDTLAELFGGKDGGRELAVGGGIASGQVVLGAMRARSRMDLRWTLLRDFAARRDLGRFWWIARRRTWRMTTLSSANTPP